MKIKEIIELCNCLVRYSDIVSKISEHGAELDAEERDDLFEAAEYMHIAHHTIMKLIDNVNVF